ncbi:MAG: EAL domain-containing protein [Gammaproteobacteria bacterium]
MIQPVSVDIFVISPKPDAAESVSQNLRNAGVAARCEWLGSEDDLADALTVRTPQLIFFFVATVGETPCDTLAPVRDQNAPGVPLILVAPQVDEDAISRVLISGGQDLVSLGNAVRMRAVALRELSHYRQRVELASMQNSAEKLEEQVATLVNESADAIMLVQEGIVVNVNPAWLGLLGYSDEADLEGTPALDTFEESSHVAIKAAMVATNKGEWSGHSLDVKAIGSDESAVPVGAEFEKTVFDEEPCVRIVLTLDQAKTEDKPRDIVEGSERHPLTGFFRRQRFLNEMGKHLESPSRGGLWLLAYIKPDSIAELREQIGPLSSDDLLLEFARLLQDQARQNDIYGQFGGDLFMVLMPRGTARDALAWAENLRQAVSKRVFAVADKSLSATCTIGLARFNADTEDLHDLIIKAQKAYLSGVKAGGNRTVLPDLDEDEEGHRTGDTVHIKKIKGALMQDNFRLVFQPVASLGGRSQQMFDVLLRMVDGGREVMPSTFLPPAKRNGLMKTIDRWVIRNAIRFCSEHQPAGLFIRLSTDSVLDETLAPWIGQQVAESNVSPRALIFQITESDIEARLLDAKNLAASLKSLGCAVALEHFGVTQQPLRTLEHVQLDYLKIDGSLMEGIATDKDLQEQVREYIDVAKEKRIATVAERVEDANTMAVLWSLGIEYIQGFYVQGPEEIVLEDDGVM